MTNWSGTFYLREDSQIIGKYVSCADFMIDFGRGDVPVDWNRLREYDRWLYEDIEAQVRAEFANGKSPQSSG